MAVKDRPSRRAGVEEAADRVLREREAQLRTVSELMSDCCWIRTESPDGTSRRTWVSGSFERITGYATEEFETVGREGLVHPDDLSKIQDYITGPPGVSEHVFRIVTKGGEVRWLHERMRVCTQPGCTATQTSPAARCSAAIERVNMFRPALLSR